MSSQSIAAVQTALLPQYSPPTYTPTAYTNDLCSKYNTISHPQTDPPPQYSAPTYTPVAYTYDTYKSSKPTTDASPDRSIWSAYVKHQDEQKKAMQASETASQSRSERLTGKLASGCFKMGQVIGAAQGISMPVEGRWDWDVPKTCFSDAHDTALRQMLASSSWWDSDRLESGPSLLETHPDLPQLMLAKVSHLQADNSVVHTAKKVKHSFTCARNSCHPSKTADQEEETSRAIRSLKQEITTADLFQRDLVKQMKGWCYEIDCHSRALLSARTAQSKLVGASAFDKFWMRSEREIAATIRDSESALESYYSVLADNLQEYYAQDALQFGLKQQLESLASVETA